MVIFKSYVSLPGRVDDLLALVAFGITGITGIIGQA
jgi:hypothetical protein